MPFSGSGITVTGPARFAVFVDQDIGKDDFSSRLAQTLHQVGVAFQVDVLDDAENADFRVDRPQGSVLFDPHLGQIVADEIAADHGGGGLAAARGRRAGKIGFTAVRGRSCR